MPPKNKLIDSDPNNPNGIRMIRIRKIQNTLTSVDVKHRQNVITGGVPIILKLATGDVEKNVKLAVKANPDIIAIDGMAGGTEAAPEVILNEVEVPTIMALAKAREVIDKLGVKQELWVGGGLNKGGDFAKVLALGTDTVFIATSLLVAMGCNRCGLCYLGKCPYGITTKIQS